MQGILLVDKPPKWTSFDVVNYVRKMARRAALVESYKVEREKLPQGTLNFKDFQLSAPLPKVKVGHTGTLDPLATGLLVLLIGKDYTRRAGEFSKLDKTYEVEMTLGYTSTTGDSEGEKSLVSDKKPERKDIEAALRQFTGEISQIPPAFSAIKVNGRRAYELARKGEVPKLEPREVTIYKLQLISYDYPKIKLATDVSSGTYIRTLVEDIGEALGTGAYTSELRRTKVGDFSIDNAGKVEDDSLLDKLDSID